MAYELMQTRKMEKLPLDWSRAYYSLDDIYYYGGQGSHNQIAILGHKPANNDEMAIKIGDTVGKCECRFAHDECSF